MTRNHHVPTPRIEEAVWIFSKLTCFFVSYVLAAGALLSFFWSPCARAIACLDRPGLRFGFGVYLLLTGVSILKTARWRAVAAAQREGMSESFDLEKRAMRHRDWLSQLLFQGYLTVALGCGVLVTAVRVWLGWSGALGIFHLSRPGLTLLGATLGPTVLAATLGRVITLGQAHY